MNARTTRYNQQHSERLREIEKARRYGITVEQLRAVLAPGKCAICGDNGARHAYGPGVDHDHATGAVRGLLCAHCNSGLGQFKDSPKLLAAAIDYLRFHAEVIAA